MPGKLERRDTLSRFGRGRQFKDPERIVKVFDRDHSDDRGFANNSIRTTKYTVYNFLLKNLFEQFHRLANVYFLFIVVLNWVPSIQAFGKEVAMLPLLFVLSVTSLKDIFEDRRRARQDRQTNNRPAAVYNRETKEFESQPWKALHVGDIVKLECDDIIPADLLLLASTHEDRICFLETANIDGETNLKQRRVYCERDYEAFQPAEFDDVLECELPNAKIYHFNGNIPYNGRPVPLDSSNLLLRGCVLRNTESVIGLIVYAGHDTKAMLNNTGPRSKRSKLERAMNYNILYCCILLLILCICGGLGSGIWTRSRNTIEVPYLPPPPPEGRNPALEGFTRVWTFFIILQVMVPISLYVSIEMVKLFQVYFIQADEDMYDTVHQRGMACRALNVTEDLGQIQYIFSDKTGTLTQNKMVFHMCSINGNPYYHNDTISHDEVEEEKSTAQTVETMEEVDEASGEASADKQDESAPLSSSCEQFTFPRDRELLDLTSKLPQTIEDVNHMFMLSLAASNTVVPNQRGDKMKYEAESPDEAAIVAAAAAYSYKLTRRTTSTCTVSINGTPVAYTCEAVLEFDSTRKRMSVVLRTPDNKLVLLTKGADSAIFHILKDDELQSKKDATMQHLNEFAHAGLRTLCFAMRVISEDEYQSWSNRFLNASVLMGKEREEQRRNLIFELETNMTLLGATGIEDKLQDGVPQAISDLREAGIKIWVLTGDKQETAIEIAKTSCLLDEDMTVLLLNSPKAVISYDTPDNTESHQHHMDATLEVHTIIKQKLEELTHKFGDNMSQTEIGLVIDGPTLFYALKSDNEINLDFLRLAEQVKVVVACRTTPLQKAQVVALVKENRNVMTLAVGDGANDVSMIQMANIGVGIAGQEGMQAVMASDFAIGQFRFLVKLLLVHGHWCYDRLASMILYFFYKNSCLVWVIFFFQLYCGFSGQPAIEQMYLQTYNLLWTSFLPIASAVFDQTAPAKVLMKNPALYMQGRLDLSYRGKFFPTMLDGLFQSLIQFFIPYLVFKDTIKNEGVLVFGTVTIFGSVFANHLQLLITTKTYIWIHYVLLAWSSLGFFAFAFAYNGVNWRKSLTPDPYFVMQECARDFRFWACLVLIPIASVGPRFMIQFYQDWFTPSAASFAREKVELHERAKATYSAPVCQYPCMCCQSIASLCVPYKEPVFHQMPRFRVGSTKSTFRPVSSNIHVSGPVHQNSTTSMA
eukprot:m.11630 g.11630  ORF g.11630 m.11630 type:complete len:1209 (+) comp5754_c0_seq1:260-3886(+)